MQPKLLATIALICFVGSLLARGLPPVAAVKSSAIPPAVLQGGTVQCTFIGPNGTHTALAINNFCWDGYVYQAGIYTIKAQNFTTGIESSGSDYVPDSECTSGTPPQCVIQLGSPIAPPMKGSE